MIKRSASPSPQSPVPVPEDLEGLDGIPLFQRFLRPRQVAQTLALAFPGDENIHGKARERGSWR